MVNETTSPEPPVKTMNYYNENDPFAAQWLRELIRAEHISKGEVDERSITDVRASDLRGFTQCHFFAGIGVWSYALRQSGWADDRQVWTGSCPCQPFSAAGRRGGFTDERHLWPTFYQLIRECRPSVIFGEQVASKDGLAWFDAVYDDLEDASYAVGAADLCAAGFGAPHIRQRLYFVADANYKGPQGRSFGGNSTDKRIVGENGLAGSLDNATGEGLAERPGRALPRGKALSKSQRSGDISFWGAHDEIGCLDGRSRPIEPGTFPLVDGTPNRVGRLRGYGNALVAPVAQGFIEAYLDVEGQQ